MEKAKRPKDGDVEMRADEDEVQLDLEAFTPTDSDIFGIQLLLQQLLRGVKSDTRVLAELIVKYNCGASIMKQIDDVEDAIEEEVEAGQSSQSGTAEENGEASSDGCSAVLSLFSALPRSERAVHELLHALVARCSKDSSGYENLAKAASEGDSLFVVMESIANFPAKIAAAMCAQFVEADLQTSATQYVSYRSVHNVVMARRVTVQPDEESDSTPAESRVAFIGDEDSVFAEFASATCVFEHATGSKNKQKREQAKDSAGGKRKRSKRRDVTEEEAESGSENEEDGEEEVATGVALLLLTFEQFVAAVQKLKSTYLQ